MRPTQQTGATPQDKPNYGRLKLLWLNPSYFNMLFTVLAFTVIAAATAAGPDLEMEGSVSDPPAPEGPHPTAASDSTLSLSRRALAITAGADACTGTSAGLPAAECSAWQDLYNKTGGTDSGVLNSTGVIEQCALSLTDPPPSHHALPTAPSLPRPPLSLQAPRGQAAAATGWTHACKCCVVMRGATVCPFPLVLLLRCRLLGQY